MEVIWYCINHIFPDFPQIEITSAGVIKLLKDLDPSKSTGPDRIPGKLLKLLSSEISPCLVLAS